MIKVHCSEARNAKDVRATRNEVHRPKRDPRVPISAFKKCSFLAATIIAIAILLFFSFFWNPDWNFILSKFVVTFPQKQNVVVMPITRCNSQIPVPPPSPIPTARGSRSAANEIFCQFLEKTLRLPELTLPESQFPPAPAEIDFRLLPLASVDQLMRSAREFGAFRIRCHGISGHELGMVEEEAERVFQGSENVFERNGSSGKMIPCVHSRKGALELTAQKFLGTQTHRSFWVHMGNIGSRLDGIVEKVTLALQQDTPQEFKERIQDTESVICLCRYPHDKAHQRNEGMSDEKNDRFCDHALRFYLPMEHCIFYIQTERGPLSFDAGPETIVVTVGKQLEEWSHGEFKCVPGEMIFSPSFQSSQQASFSIELTCSTSNLNQILNNSDKIISLTDQMLFVLCLAFLYKFLYFILP